MREQFLNPKTFLSELNIHGAMHIADLGSGSGHLAIPIAERLKKGVVHAFDVQPAQLEILRRSASERHIYNVQTMLADLEKPESTRLATHSMDVTLLSNILFQISDKRLVAKEAARITKPSGEIVVVEWAQHAIIGPKSEHRIPKDSLKAIFADLGWKLKRDVRAGSHHYALIFTHP